MNIKSIIAVVGILLFTTCNTYAQCDFDDDTLVIGQVLSTNATCPSSGSITINNVTGGGGIYVYEIIDGPVIRMIQSQNVFNALPAGSYLVRVSGCNGDIQTAVANINSSYANMNSYYWQNSLQKISGLSCGITNNGVYKLPKPSYTGGTAPFRIQISTTSSFSSVPYQPGYDSAQFSNLNASTIYYIRVTDACNNFVTFNFTTPPATPATPLSVPSLSFQRAYYYGECTGRETVYIYFRDSATGNYYNASDAFSGKAIWGNLSRPYLRMKIEDAGNGTLYSDKNILVNNYGGNTYYMSSDDYSTMVGETGLTSPGTGKGFYSINEVNGYLPLIYASSSFPINTPLKVTIYFPGGDHCGTTIPAYSRTFYYNLGQRYKPQAYITAITPNCDNTGTFLRVDFDNSWAGDTIKLVKLLPSYTELRKINFSSGFNTYTTIYYSPLIPGDTYRVIIRDSCGRADSMDVVYNPSSAIVPPPTITHDIKINYKCPVNPNDAIYNIVLYPLPAGYSILGITIDGIGTVYTTSVANWNGTGVSVNMIDKLFPPGTYTYRVTWLNNCQTGTVVNTITITPSAVPPIYNRDINLSLYTQAGACFTDGYRAIKITGFIKNSNTNYRFSRLRVLSPPNNYVFPIFDLVGIRLNNVNSSMYMYQYNIGDSLTIYPDYSGVKINPGQEGTYTIAVDVVCPDGTLIETISKTINVPATVPVTPYMPNLKYSNALRCGISGSDVKINMMPDGGTRPFTYEFKRDTAVNYQLTTNGGADSVVVITPAPDPGTIFDIRVTDACGNSSTNRVTVASFTGQFFIYSYAPDCINNPFTTRVGTSWIRGAYYTWRRNGIIVGQGYNMPSLNLLGITSDSITVDVDLYNCYSAAAGRTIVSPNPCNVMVLPVNTLKLSGIRTSSFNVQLNWKSVNEQKSIKYFDLEKSIDGIHFTTVTRVIAKEMPWEHSYIHNDPESASIVYYRLRTYGKNGKEFITPIIKIENTKINKTLLSVSPNPAHDNISLVISTDRVRPYKAKIFDSKGQQVKEVSISPDEVNSKKIDLVNLPDGSYFISLIDNWEIIASTKFIKY